MAWPQANEFQEAVQNPRSSFSDPDLQAAEVGTNPLGLPHGISGQFGIVYQMRSSQGKGWAVKCFTGPSAERQHRYKTISTHLNAAKLPFIVGFDYQEKGIRIRGQWYPILKMDWVEGQTLNQFVRERLDQPQLMHFLVGLWGKLAKWLRDADVTHADLQHGNVMMVPGQGTRFSMRLVDYDGMYLPLLARSPSGEIGHRDYQHPQRLATSYYGPEVDRFSHLVIQTALRALSVHGKPLWDKYDQGDNLLFLQEDYQSPKDSKVLRELWQNGPDDVRSLAGRLVLAAQQPLQALPPFEEAVTLTAAQERQLNLLLGKVVSLPEPESDTVLSDSDFELELGEFDSGVDLADGGSDVISLDDPDDDIEEEKLPPPPPPPPPSRITKVASAASQPSLSDGSQIVPFRRMAGDDVRESPLFKENRASFVPAYGLAAQGLKRTFWQTNLLPPEKRTWGSRLGRMFKRHPSGESAWGIEIGQCALKALRLELAAENESAPRYRFEALDTTGQEIKNEINASNEEEAQQKIRQMGYFVTKLTKVRNTSNNTGLLATAFDYIEYPKILSQPDADPDQLTHEALQTFLSRNEIKGDMICLGVPGQSGLSRICKLPPVLEKQISEIVKFEAKQQIPFPLEEVVWDYQRIGSPNVVDGFALETEIGLFAMKRDMIYRYLKPFKDLEIEVHVVQMTSIALYNIMAYDVLGKDPGHVDAGSGRKKCMVFLDMGVDGTNLVIGDGERIIWQRPIPIGGSHFTRALTKELKLTFAKAEHVKRNAVKLPELASILKAFKPVLEDLVGEIQRSLGYFTNTHRNAHVDTLLLVGNGLRIPGMNKYLGEKLAINVQKCG